MTTLPLFPSELLAVPKLRPSEIPVDRWLAASEALPADGVTVYCYVPSFQRRRAMPNIVEMHIESGQWIPETWCYEPPASVPLEAVDWWMGIERPPAADDSGWIPVETFPPVDLNTDVWIWNGLRNRARSFWIETGHCPGKVGEQMYYGVSDDPVLHDEYVTKWMVRLQPNQIEDHFIHHFGDIWMSDVSLLNPTRLPARPQHGRQIKLDFSRDRQ